MYTDSHAHLSSDLFLESESLIRRAVAAKVSRIVNICTDIASLQNGLILAKTHPELVNVGATTPHDVEKEGEVAFPEFEKAAKSNLLVAIGETGLDYHYEHSPKKLQQSFLQRYLKLALETDLPVVFHCREAFHDLFAITDEHYKNKPAILHCFTGNAEEALGVLERGWMISFSGILTFKKSVELREIAKAAPLSQILIETDSPYLAPQSHRGKRNEPAFVIETAKCLAELKNLPLETIAEATTSNANKFFRFKN